MDEKSSLLPRISVTRPVTVTMCLVAILAVGLVSHARIRIQAFPSGRDWPGISMRIDTLPNSSARERDEQIGRPVMEHFRTLKDLHSLTVGSRKSHLSVYLMFKKDADMTEVYNRVLLFCCVRGPMSPETIQHEKRSKRLVLERHKDEKLKPGSRDGSKTF